MSRGVAGPQGCIQPIRCTVRFTKAWQTPLGLHRLKNFSRHSPTRRYSLFPCNFPGCTRGFPHKGDFLRHQREVHRIAEGSKRAALWYCPFSACRRNKEGFPRRWNFREHLRRVHADRFLSENSQDPASLSSPQVVQLSIEQSQHMSSSLEDSFASQQSANSYTSIHASISQLQSKKAELVDYFRTETMKLDSGIRTLENALQIITDGVR